MQEKIEQLKIAVGEELEKVESNKVLYDLKARFMGKNGEITALLRGMKDVPPESRSAFGKLINDLKNEVEGMFNKKELILIMEPYKNNVVVPLETDEKVQEIFNNYEYFLYKEDENEAVFAQDLFDETNMFYHTRKRFKAEFSKYF